LLREREAVRRIAGRYGLTRLRVFGSVARSQETAGSDIDLLVDVAPSVGLLRLARCQRELQLLLGAPVDLVPASDLKPAVARTVLDEALPL
jgi:predicted nucleotidyltransferase